MHWLNEETESFRKRAFFRWKFHINNPSYRRRIKYAKKAIYKALETKAKFYISWSSGKDSTALVHIVRSIDQTIPIIIQFDDSDWIEKRKYVKKVAKENKWEYSVVEPEFSIFEAMKSRIIGEENFCSTSDTITKEGFLNLLEEERLKLGCDGVFLGLRAEESNARKIHLNIKKELYEKSNGLKVCNPLAKWSATDVFTYLYENKVEINPCYFYNFFKTPEKIRLSWAVPTPSGISHGDLEHLKRYQPRLIHKLKQAGFF